LDITTVHRSGFLSAQIRITLNDLECPIQLKVRFTDGTLGVRPYAYRCSQRGRGSGLTGLEVLAPSMWAADALFLCGS